MAVRQPDLMLMFCPKQTITDNMTVTSSTHAYPTPPATSEQLGVPETLIEDLNLQRLVLDGRSSVTRMAAATALSVGIVDSTVDRLRQRLLLEIQGMDGRDYILAPTDKGKAEAASRAVGCSYAGCAPVSLGDYTAVVDRQRGREPITFDTLAEAFDDLIIAPGFFCLLYTSTLPTKIV